MPVRKWMGDVFNSPIGYRLFVDQKEMLKEAKKVGANSSQLEKMQELANEHKGAFTYHLDNVCVVWISKDQRYDDVQVFSLIVHESVHVWQRICDFIGEDMPGEEIEAYSIQQISQNLVDQYKQLTR